ncbi:serine/threonine-protein kinase MPS1 [Chrysoperla carnea]|uniref:serine/threonine-protein kinase MPS1 n=1 Tax=Chrysoperla carnea TaxID=189513 RepID=UPI001D0644DC|nr:serine/threonine-protein kinase MPS1 [Chrysoperla carnea]
MSAKNEKQTLDKNKTFELYPLSFGNGNWDPNYDLKLVQYTLEPPDSPQPVSEFLKRRSEQNNSNNSTPKSIFNDSFCVDNSLEDDNDYSSSPEDNSNAHNKTDVKIFPPSSQQIFQTPLQKPKTNENQTDGQEPVRNSLFSAIKYKALHYKTPTKDAENPVKNSIMSSLQKNDNILLTQQRILNSDRFNSYSTPKDSKPLSSGSQQFRKGLNFNTKIKDNAENHLDSIKEIEYSPPKTNMKILTDISNEKIDDVIKKASIFKQSEYDRKNSPENENFDSIYFKLNQKQQTSSSTEENLQKLQQRTNINQESLNFEQNSRQIDARLNDISKKISDSDQNNSNDSKRCRNDLSDRNLNELSTKKASPQNDAVPKCIKSDNYNNEQKIYQNNQFDKKHEFPNSQQYVRQFEHGLNKAPSKNIAPQNEAVSKAIIKKDNYFNELKIGQNNNFGKINELSNSQQNSRQIEASMDEIQPKKSSSQNETLPKSSIKSYGYNSNYFNEPKSSQNNQIDKIHEFSNSQQNSRQIQASMNEVPQTRNYPQNDLIPRSIVAEAKSCQNYPQQEESNRNKNYISGDEFKKPDIKPIQNSKNILPGNAYPQINEKQRPVPHSVPTPSNKKPEQFNNNPKPSIQFPLLTSTVKPTLVGRTLQIQNVEYLIKSKLGEGGSCEVYEGTNVENSRNFAIKCVNLAVDPITAKGYMSEIQLLAKLQSSDYVIKMFAYEQIQDKLYVIMEKGEMDLGQLIENSKNLHIAMVVYYWIEMLTAVKCIHDNGVIHSDLKPANFLMVKGRLKLIDFGIASVVHDDCTSIIKNTQAGTLNYISPEALIDTRDFSSANSDMNINISYKSDVWSLGCILYKFLYGKTPFQHITHKMTKFTVLTDKNHVIDYPNTIRIPPKLLTTLKKCLIFEMRKRPSVDELLKVNYVCFNNCD